MRLCDTERHTAADRSARHRGHGGTVAPVTFFLVTKLHGLSEFDGLKKLKTHDLPHQSPQCDNEQQGK